MPLDHDLHDFLLQLERAQADGQDWVAVADVAAIPSQQRDQAVSKGWVKQKGFGNLAQYKILTAGYSALGSNAEFILKQLTGVNVTALVDQVVEDALVDHDDDPASRSHIRSLIQPVGDPVVFSVEEPTPVVNGKTCCEPGCNEPRYSTAKNNFNRCEAHQKALWRKRQTAKMRSTPKTQPHIAIIEPPIADDDTQPDIAISEPVIPPEPVVTVPGHVDTPPVLTRLLARAAVKFLQWKAG